MLGNVEECNPTDQSGLRTVNKSPEPTNPAPSQISYHQNDLMKRKSMSQSTSSFLRSRENNFLPRPGTLACPEVLVTYLTTSVLGYPLHLSDTCIYFSTEEDEDHCEKKNHNTLTIFLLTSAGFRLEDLSAVEYLSWCWGKFMCERSKTLTSGRQ